jgi:putative ATP-binding cassette transporter
VPPVQLVTAARGLFPRIAGAGSLRGPCPLQANAMPTAPIAAYDLSVTRHLRVLVHAIGRTPGRRRLYLLAGAIVVAIVATAVMQVRLNAWNQPFYDAIQRRSYPDFLHQLGVFFMIAGALLVLNVAQTGLNQAIKVKMRELATKDLIGCWMSRKRAARISRAGEIGVNPDQRIQADTQTLTELTTDLGVGLVQSSILLASFIGVLWGLSRGVVLPVAGHDLVIPGYMVWAALLYAGTGSLISWRVGRPLVRLGTEHYSREAEFRFALVQGSERAEGIALSNGEAQSRAGIDASLDRLTAILRDIVMARVRLTWVTAGYGWVALVFPIIVAAPGYFAGRLSFGELMMVVGAFNQVQQSLRWFVDNTSSIADWRATLLRVMNFRQALLDLDDVEARAGLIARSEDPKGIVLEAVRVETRHGCVALDTPRLEVGPGERALILGKPGSGRTSFFLAIAGLWSAGSGRISVPPDGNVAYMTQLPFLPSVALREAVAPPGRRSSDEELRTALVRVGLDAMVESLDRVARWNRDLTLGEQERLGYARLLLARPKWLIADEGLDPLDEGNRAMILSILTKELAETAVVNISHRHDPDDFYDKVVELVTTRLEAPPPEVSRQPAEAV